MAGLVGSVCKARGLKTGRPGSKKKGGGKRGGGWVRHLAKLQLVPRDFPSCFSKFLIGVEVEIHANTRLERAAHG